MGDSIPSEKKLKDVFDDCSSGDGSLDKDEFKSLCYRFYLSPTNSEVNDKFKQLDKNSDDKLTFDEVKTLIEELWTSLEERKEAFRADIRDCMKNDGPITRDDLKGILTRGEDDDALTEEDLDFIFSKMDLDGNKKITLEELTDLLFEMDPEAMSRAVSRCESRKSRRKSKSRSRSNSRERKRSRSGSRERKRSRSKSSERKGSRSRSRDKSRSRSRDSKRSGSGKRHSSAGSHRSGSGHGSRKNSRQEVIEVVQGTIEHSEQENTAKSEQEDESLNQETKQIDEQQESSSKQKEVNNEQNEENSEQKEEENSAQKEEVTDQTNNANEQKDNTENDTAQKTDTQQSEG